MRASVVIVTYNHRSVVGNCLAALEATLTAADEVLVVDNASADGTAAWVQVTFPWARTIPLQRNLGFGAGCNWGARAASGEFVVFLNPDTLVTPGWLDALLAPFAWTQAPGMTTAKLTLAKAPHRIDAFGNDIHISGITPSRRWGDLAASCKTLEEVPAVSGACFAMPRALFDDMGGFDERLFLYFEDTELSLRVRLGGRRCLAVPDSVVLHDHVDGFTPSKLRFLERNRWWTLLKVYRWRTFVALAPVLVLSEVIAWGLAATSGLEHVRAKADAWLDVLAWLPALPESRNATQALRAVDDSALIASHATRLPFAQAGRHPLLKLAERVAALGFGGGRRVAGVIGLG